MDLAYANHPQQAGYRLTRFVEELASHFPVTSPDIADGTILFSDINQNACATNEIMKWNGASWVCAVDSDTTGAVGMTGMAGATGMTGMTGVGSLDFTFVFQYDTTDIFILPGESLIFSSACPFPLESVVSGGVEELLFETQGFFMAESYPFDFATWVVRVENTSPFIVNYKIWIVCLEDFSFPTLSATEVTASDVTASKAREAIVLEPIPISQPNNVRGN